MNNLRPAKAPSILLLCYLATVIASPAQTFKTLVDFDGSNGVGPGPMSFVQGPDGNLYGTTGVGDFPGTIFKITPAGKLTTLYTFCQKPGCADGLWPKGGPILANDGNFYGTTSDGGATPGEGLIYKMTPEGTMTTLYIFCAQGAPCTDGSGPYAPLFQARDGNFYGTTSAGGANCTVNGNIGCGTVFKISPAGVLTTLYSFCSQSHCTDGNSPLGGLVQATDGNLYGTTFYGGTNNTGIVFKITTSGAFTTLYNFCYCENGGYPYAGLMQATDGYLYGTTARGGTYSDGTVFKMTTAGALTTLHSFCAQPDCPDGEGPQAPLIQATDGNLYGTTPGGGALSTCTIDCGTVFKITSTGTLTTLHTFDGTDGYWAIGGLVQATNGVFYGATTWGGIGGCGTGCGTVYALSVGLKPFVDMRPAMGRVGAKVYFLGYKLQDTTDVSFNGTPATFTVVSNTVVKTTVPAGATTGYVTVTTPKQTLKSNVVFVVKRD